MKSFDFFDTLVTRDVANPKDIFWFLAQKLKNKELIDCSIAEFVNTRIEAENLCRLKSEYEEISIEEIYNEVKSLLNLNFSTEKYIALEKEVELESLYLISENAHLLDSDSIVISDFYFDQVFIEDVLSRLGLDLKNIYVSSDYRKMKHYGSLFLEVLNKNKITSHTGDNKKSDFDVPKSLGIKSHYYSNSELTRYEHFVYNFDASHLQFRSTLAGAMKVCRLNCHYSNEHFNSIHRISSNVIAPFVFFYVHWVLDKAVKERLDTLYFIARDGQILHKVAQIIKERFKYDIEIRYLYGSRKAWHLPAVTEINDFTLDWIFDDTAHLSVDDICDRCSISPKSLLKLLRKDYDQFVNLSSEDRSALKKQFKKNKEIHKLILNSSKKNRSIATDYLKQEEFSKDKNIGIVDVGWRGRQQKSLSTLLKLANIYPHNGIHGFYVTLNNPEPMLDRDKYYNFFDPVEHSDILGFTALYEIFVAADHGSCIGYEVNDTKIQPILREAKNLKMIDWGLSVQQSAILSFSNIFCTSIAKYDIELSNDKCLIADLLKIFLCNPESEEANTYGKLKVFEDQEENLSHSLVKPISPFIFFLHYFKIKSINHNSWLHGSVSISNPFFKPFYNALISLKHLLRKLLK